MDKIRLISESLRCHRWGWLSLIPGLGFFLAPVNWVRCLRIQREVGTGWNPAHQHLRLGLWLSAVAFFYQALIVMTLVIVVPSLDDGCNSSGGR